MRHVTSGASKQSHEAGQASATSDYKAPGISGQNKVVLTLFKFKCVSVYHYQTGLKF